MKSIRILTGCFVLTAVLLACHFSAAQSGYQVISVQNGGKIKGTVATSVKSRQLGEWITRDAATACDLAMRAGALQCGTRKKGYPQVIERMVRPERFELPTFWFVARRSIQLS